MQHNNEENDLEQHWEGQQKQQEVGKKKRNKQDKQDEHKYFEERLKQIQTVRLDTKEFPEEWINKYKNLLLKQQNKK